MNGLLPLQNGLKELTSPFCLSIPPTMWGHSIQNAISEAETGPSVDTEPASAMILASDLQHWQK
jgi:hypothetical protein